MERSNNYASRIYELRKKEDISQEALAAALGTTRQQVSRWECGTSIPSPKFAYALAAYFKCSVDDLFGEGALEEKEDFCSVFNAQFRNICVILCVFAIVGFYALTLLGFYSDELAHYLHIVVGEMREAGANYDPATINVAIRNLSESICRIGVALSIVSSLIYCFALALVLIRYMRNSKSKIVRSGILLSSGYAFKVILSTLMAGILTLTVGQHVGYLKAQTLGLFDGTLYLLGSFFASDVLLVLFAMILRKPFQRKMVLRPWEGGYKVFDILYVCVGLPLFIVFLSLASSSYVGFAFAGFIYFPLAGILFIVRLLITYFPLRNATIK